MKTAVIVLNYNSKEDTIRYVGQIKNYSCIDVILVVDNKSTNPGEFQELKQLKDDKVYVIQSDKNGGYSYGNNFGLKFLEAYGQ
ncbi:MAG: glycosyltransferase, partial [Clostridia bacterium]|nr:glycosyltransferase [Clostridia bacterium]